MNSHKVVRYIFFWRQGVRNSSCFYQQPEKNVKITSYFESTEQQKTKVILSNYLFKTEWIKIIILHYYFYTWSWYLSLDFPVPGHQCQHSLGQYLLFVFVTSKLCISPKYLQLKCHPIRFRVSSQTHQSVWMQIAFKFKNKIYWGANISIH